MLQLQEIHLGEQHMSANSSSRYSTVAIIFHWLIAILVIVNWRIAEAAEHLQMPEKAEVFGNHKALGMLILVLSLGRLAWRLGHKPPPMPEQASGWEKTLAKSVHVIFYILLIGLPIGGWLASSLTGRPIDFFGIFTIPMLPVGENPEAGKAIFEAHATGGSIMIYLIVLHVLGALKHSFIDKIPGLSRMWFGGSR